MPSTVYPSGVAALQALTLEHATGSVVLARCHSRWSPHSLFRGFFARGCSYKSPVCGLYRVFRLPENDGLVRKRQC